MQWFLSTQPLKPDLYSCLPLSFWRIERDTHTEKGKANERANDPNFHFELEARKTQCNHFGYSCINGVHRMGKGDVASKVDMCADML